MTQPCLQPVDGPLDHTRRHVLKVFAAGLGGVLLGPRLPRALAELPWGDGSAAELLQAGGKPLALGRASAYDKAARQIAPALALEPTGARLWTSWAQLHDGHEALMVRSFSIRDERWGDMLELTDLATSVGGHAYESDLGFVRGRLLVAWSQALPDGWAVYARSVDPATGERGAIQRLSGSAPGEFHGHAALAAANDRALVVWQARRGDRKTYAIVGCFLDADGKATGGVFELAVDPIRDCSHPAVAAGPDGRSFAVAYDRQDQPAAQNVYVVRMDSASGHCDEPRAASRHPASNVAPALAYSPDGDWLWVAWHTNRSGVNGWDIPRWYRLAGLRLADHTWHAPPDQPEPAALDERGTVQGFELVRLAASPQGVVCVLGRASQNFYVQYYTRGGRSPLYRLPPDGWGGRGRLLPGVFDADGSLWVTRRELGTNALQQIEGFAGLSGPPVVEPYAEPAQRELRSLAGVTPRHAWPTSSGPAEGMQLYFGDLHGHTWQSDGMGDPEESYARARDVFRDDFHVLTDHDHFVDKRITDAQWAEQKALAEHFHVAGQFVTLFGQEWTTPRVGNNHGWGHFNVYSADPAIPLFDHADERLRDLPDLYAALRAHQALAIPHHIGWTGIPWDALDAALTPVIEICSVHGAFEYEGNEPIPHRGAMHGCFLRDGLLAGKRIGVVGGSDQHGLIWQHGVCWKRNVYRAGLTGVWAPELTRAALLDALRARRTFATTGVKLHLLFTVNDQMMGADVRSDTPPGIRADIAIPPTEGRLAWLEIVRDGTTIRRCGPEGLRTRFVFTDEECPMSGTACYYVRVRLADGNMAWSSPVWVTRA